ncbi:MAG: hypothetical protein IPL39_19815 [Opitutaceae bacterium]|nr:hypothetical protein [Opitutaceae bacterium]
MQRLLAASLLLCATSALAAAPQALVLEASWDRFSQHTDLRYTHLGTQTRIESTATDKPDPYLLVDTAQDQRITVYRHNSSWRCDPLEPKPRNDSPAGAPGMPAMPQPPPGIGPQGQIGPRTGPTANTAALPPTPGYGAPAGYSPSIPQSAIRDPQSPAPGAPAGIGPRGPLGPRTGAARPAIPQLPPDFGPQGGVGASALPAGPATGGAMGAGLGGMPMPPRSAMQGREALLSLTKTEETQTLLGRTTVKYTVASRMMETLEVWAVPDTDFGAFFAYRPQPPHRFGPVDLQDHWDSLLRREHLFPLLAIFKQGDREIARFTVTKIDHSEIADIAAFFSPPLAYYKSPPDTF